MWVDILRNIKKYVPFPIVVLLTICTISYITLVKYEKIIQKGKQAVSSQKGIRKYTNLRIDSASDTHADHNNNWSSPSVNTSQVEFKVPNVVHYVWYMDEPVEFRFDKALSVLSAVKYIKPDAVYFHTNMEPTGKYYEMLKNISIFKVVHREPPKSVLTKIFHETDYSDYDRVKILIEQGGIYLDLDVMVTSSFDDIRKHDCTLGFESGSRVCSGIIVCQREHPFLYLWLNSYYDDFRKQWAYNSGFVSSKIIQRYPNMLHVEQTKLHRPNFYELDKIWGTKKFSWRKNYAVHTWIRIALRQSRTSYPTEESIKTMNSTYGEIARDVFYGSPDIV